MLSVRCVVHACACVLVWTACLHSPAQAASPNLDFKVVDETSYQAFKTAIEKSEYAKYAYVNDPKPRVATAVAGLLEYATRNPLADDVQQTAFVNALDTELRNFFVDGMMMPTDEDLQRGSHLMTAARFSTPLTGVPELVGTDTDVGAAIMRLLDIDIPAPNRYEEYQDRMEVFELVRSRRFGNSTEWSNLLMIGFSGQDLSGEPNAHLPSVLEAYLTAQGYPPMEPPLVCMPSIIGTVDTGKAKGVVVSGDYAYVADEQAGLVVVDISDPEMPTVLGSVNVPGLTFDVDVSGGYACLASHFGGGFDVVDISNPAMPMVVGSIGLGNSYSSVVVQGTLAYVTNDPGLTIIDISNPAMPSILGSVMTPDLAHWVAVSGTTAYVADRLGDLQVVDVSNPAMPMIIGSGSAPGAALGIDVSGGLVYIASGAGGLVIFDVTNPAMPVLLGSVPTPGSARGVTVVGGRAYIADESGGLQVIDVIDPAMAQIIGSVGTPDVAFGIAVADGTAFLGDEQSGLQVIDVSSCPENPVTAGLAFLPADFAAYDMLLTEVEDAAAMVDPMDPFGVASQAMRRDALDATTLISTAHGCLQAVVDNTQVRLDELALALDPMNEVDLVQGVANDSDPTVIAQINAKHRENLDEVAAERATLGATSILLQQADDTTQQPDPMVSQMKVTTAEDLSSYIATSTETFFDSNRNMAAVSQGVQIAGGLGQIIAGLAMTPKNPVGVVTGTVNIITSALGMASLFNEGPTPEEMIMEQLQEMSMQIEGLQVEMNERFDRVEAQLNQVYQQIDASLIEIQMSIGHLQNEVEMNGEFINLLRFDMLNAQASLDRIEEALWGVGATLLLSQFADDFDSALGFRADTLKDFAVIGQLDNFNSSAGDLSQFATLDAASPPFAGPSSVALTPQNARAQLALDDVGMPLPTPLSIGRKINDLAAYPGTIPMGSALGSGLAGPGAWAQGASAFAQLLRESPWYYAERPATVAEMTSVIAKGAALETAARNGRDQVLLDHLFAGWRAALEPLTDLILDKLFNPVYVGSLIPPDDVEDVAVSGTRAYLAADFAGLVIIDVANPATPVVLGALDTPGRARGVAVRGSLAYVADLGSGLAVIDVSNPASPVIVGTVDTPHLAQSVVLSGDFAFVADRSAGLQVIDVSDPAAPMIVGSVDTPGAALNLAVMGDLVLVADSLGGLKVIDVSDPAVPVIVGTVPHNTPFQGIRDVASGAAPSLAYVLDGRFLRTVDVSNPASPAIVGSVDFGPGIGQRVVATGTTAYVSGGGSYAFQIIDCSVPTSPVIVRSFDVGAITSGIDVGGTTAYVYSSVVDLQLVDLVGRPLDDAWLDVLDCLDTDPALAAPQETIAGWEELIEAFMTFSMPEVLEQSGVARAVLRTSPIDTSNPADGLCDVCPELSIGPVRDILSGYVGNSDAGPGTWPADILANVQFLQDEVNSGLAMFPAWGHPYIDWNLASLRQLSANRLKLAVDDTYEAEQGQTLIVTAPGGVITNDVMQEYRPICVDSAFTPIATSQGGTVMIMDDGSFTYMPPNGTFTGTDTFDYRLASDSIYRPPPMMIPACPASGFEVYSDSATVVIRVVEPVITLCPGDANGDGMVNFADITEVLGNWLNDYTPGTGPGDANGDGLVNFADITAVLGNWLALCP